MFNNSILFFILSSLFMERSYEKNLKYSKPSQQNDVSMCPYVSFVKERAEELCHFPELDIHEIISRYHCLEKQTGGYVELCIEAVTVTKGFFPKWSSSIPPRMYFEKCPHGFYQPRNGLSNEINKCKMKSKCLETIGQLTSWCPDGGTTEDQQCRCDFKRGYIANIYAFHNPLNKSCFTPSVENSACSFDDTCPEHKELDRAYRCVPKCPKDWHRPPEDLECKPIFIYYTTASTVSATSTENKTSEKATTSTRHLISTSFPPLTKSNNGVAIAILCTVTVAAIAIICGFFVFLFYCRKNIRPSAKDNIEEEHMLSNEQHNDDQETRTEEKERMNLTSMGQTEIHADKVIVHYTKIEHADNVCSGNKNIMMIETKE